jgi:hypothetical protein
MASSIGKATRKKSVSKHLLLITNEHNIRYDFDSVEQFNSDWA